MNNIWHAAVRFLSAPVRRIPGLALTLAIFLTSGCASIPTTGPDYLSRNDAIEAAHFDVNITTHDGKLLRATVFQPALKPGQSAPLIIHAHGFGVFRMSGPVSVYSMAVYSGQAAKAAWEQGYWVISYDQRGHGDSEGINHLMDADHEVRDVSTVLDWAQANLKRISADGTGDPLVGMIGESYGGGAMLLASAQDSRIDAMVPITTWHNIAYSLAPNEVPKSGWLTTLLLVNNILNPGNSDPFINEAYWKARDGQMEPATVKRLLDRSVSARCAQGKVTHADTLLIQGFRDVAFPVNEAVANMECLRSNGSDVRLIAPQGGHLLPFTQWSRIPGYYIEPEAHCGDQVLNLVDTAVNWFDAKLRQQPEKAAAIPAICLTQSEDRGIVVDRVTRGGHRINVDVTRIDSGFTGFFEMPLWPLERMAGLLMPARRHPENVLGTTGSGVLRPAFTPLYIARSDQDLVGIPTFEGVLSAPEDETDPMVFVGVAVKRANGRYYELVSDQVTPLRGTGHHQTDLMAISTRLEQGDIVGLWLFGYHNQYRFSHTGWFMEAAIEGTIALPLLGPQPTASQLTAEKL
ncbi:MAG: alpha/beta fold hydrolase [Gammaproteobacteria bacterium]